MMINNLNDYKKYKKAQQIVKDLESIQNLIDAAATGLKRYKKYIPVKEIMNIMLSNREKLDPYIEKYKKVIKDYE